MITSNDLMRWFKKGVEDKQRWMVIICDTFDYGDYPCYFTDSEKKRCTERIKAARQGDNMQRLMEVYDLSLPMDEQFVDGKLMMNVPG